MPTQAYYLKDGTRVPGVTTVLEGLGWNRAALMAWTRKQMKAGLDPQETSRISREAGSLFHLLVEGTFSGVRVDTELPDDIRKPAMAAYHRFLEWRKTVRLEVVSLECPLVSERLRVGGTLDWVGRTDAGLTLIDWKSSTGIYGDYRIQVATYAELWAEHHGPLDAVILARFGQDGSHEPPEQLTKERLAAGVKTFEALRVIYDQKAILDPPRRWA